MGSNRDMKPTERLQWPAPKRNKQPILEILDRVLPKQGTILEIGAGSGEHTATFAGHFADVTWQATDPEEEHRLSVQAWIDHAGITNALPPLELDTRRQPWPVAQADAVLCINMIHISPWDSCLGLFAGASEILSPGGIVYLYGPFSIDGAHTAPSNATFDQSLKSRDPAWGVRDVGAVTAVAEAQHFRLIQQVEMPSNNLSLVFQINAGDS